MNIQNRLADLVDYAHAFHRDLTSLTNEKLMNVVSEDYKRSLKARVLKNLEEIKKAFRELAHYRCGVDFETAIEDEDVRLLVMTIGGMM